MAFPSLSLFSLAYCFFTLILLVHGKLSLISSDYDALLLVQKHLGVVNGGQRSPLRDPCNHAPGISCEPRVVNGTRVLRVTRIVYESEQLRGTLSPEISILSELKELSLANNQLVEQIPSRILNCTKLEILDLSNNHFSGQLPPELSSLYGLQKLSISDNSLTGRIPLSRKSFPNIQSLSISVSGNNLIRSRFYY